MQRNRHLNSSLGDSAARGEGALTVRPKPRAYKKVRAPKNGFGGGAKASAEEGRMCDELATRPLPARSAEANGQKYERFLGADPINDLLVKTKGKEPSNPEIRLFPKEDRQVDTERWGRVEAPAIVESLSVDAMRERNFTFYNSPASLKGMDRSIWPCLLRKSLDSEEEFVTRIAENGKLEGTFVELGCGTGKYLPMACRNFQRVVGVDYSMLMLTEAAVNIANTYGPTASGKTLLVHADMADVVPFVPSGSVDFALCAFNTFMNLSNAQRLRTLAQLNRILKPSEGNRIYPFLFSVYLDLPETRAMQEEFYRKMGLRVITADEDAERGFSVAQAPDGSILKSERTNENKVKALLEKQNFTLRGFIALSDVMVAAIATFERGGVRDKLDLFSTVSSLVSGREELGAP